MSYEKQIWEELPSEETPFSAERMNHIEEGIDSKLDKMVVSKSLNTAGWYRVAKYNNQGIYAKSFIVNINTSSNSIISMSHTLAINIGYSKTKIALLNTNGDNVVSKARMVKENNEIYLEIYYSANTVNDVYVDVINQQLPAGTTPKNISMLNFEAPTDTATVLDELSIGEITTGVEYATNEFLDGKRIYCVALDVGEIKTGATKTVVSNIYTINIIKIYGSLFSQSAGATWSIPNSSVSIHISRPNIYIKNETGWDMTRGKIFIYYTK